MVTVRAVFRVEGFAWGKKSRFGVLEFSERFVLILFAVSGLKELLGLRIPGPDKAHDTVLILLT